VTDLCIPLAAGAPLVEATFSARPNRFLVEAQLDGQPVEAHMADRGRLRELLRPGARLVLASHTETGRKTRFQAVAVYTERGELVSLDTLLPNRLVAAALAERLLPQFAHYPNIHPEVQIGAHRFDFCLRDESIACILEVKSVGHVGDGLALFPDAPTERGRAQIEALTNHARRGQRAAVVFIVQRSSGRAVVANERIDPKFARALHQALQAGVELYAYRCPVSLSGITLGEELPVYSSMAIVPAHV
jgi:sugar fermentation stimulation protein A